MTGSLRARFLMLGIAAFVSASAASAQEIVKAGVGSRTHMAVRRPHVSAATAGPSAAAQPDAAPAETAAPPALASAGRDTVAVMLDHAKVIRLPERSQTVIVGNPMIADITVQRNGLVVVTGKTYGVTNLIALDGSGAMLAESLVSVQAASDSIIIVQRGMERESYSCTPKCQPSILLGDSSKYFSEMGGQAGQRNGLATQR